MKRSQLAKAAAISIVCSAATVGLVGGVSTARAAHESQAAPAAMPPGVAMAAPLNTSSAAAASPSDPASSGANAAYIHQGPASPGVDLPPGNGDIMPNTTIYYVFWLPTGLHYESSSAGDTNYENLLIQWAQDLGATQAHNVVTQYNGNNGSISGAVTYGGSWTDTAAYPHAGTTGDPLQDSDIQGEVTAAYAANPSWTDDISHIVAVFTATGIQECASFGCTFDSTGGFCAYHDHFSNSGADTPYAFMAFDNFVHVANLTCNAGDTAGDTDPNRNVYPNGDKSADVEINTLSHEITEAETDPHPNDTWTAPNPEGEIGDACNFNFAPRNDQGADVILNGHGYIMQQEYSNAAHNCAIDLAGTNGFCLVNFNSVCSPTTSFKAAVDVPSPQVNSTIHYTLTLDNTNDSGAETNLALTDTLPAGYTVTGLSAPGSTSSSSTSSSVTVNYDTLAVHTSRTVTITATVPVQAGVTATNCATLTGQNLLGTALSMQTTSPCAITTPVKIPTIVTVNPATGDFNDATTVSATLTDDVFVPIAGKQLTFTLNGFETCSGTTNGFGVASCSITPSEAAGPYALAAAFTDGTDPVYATSSGSSTFTVTKEETTTAYTGSTVLLGSSATLQGTLLEDGTTPIVGRTLTLGLGSTTCTAPTNIAGVATCTVSTGTLGSQTLSATFAGDAFYLPSSDSSKTAIVFAFPSSGVFTIGDTTAASAGSSPVTWWDSSWNKLNALTGGAAPSAEKGFVSGVTLPSSSPANVCSGNWTSNGGNSPPPPATVPSYMGVIVSDSTAKSGSTINGHYVKIVVVQTNPGYAPGPANSGTGTIVATFCP
jgi:uncharacterized repeat protein (TIGR01451 family)